MQIQDQAPFAISRDAEGAQHAVKDLIQVTVAPDLGEVDVNHRVGEKPEEQRMSRWLHVHLREAGVHIFVQGTHVVVTRRDRLPTFDIRTPEEYVAEAFRYLRAEKDERGRYVVDTPANRRTLARLGELIQVSERNRLLAWARHALARMTQ